MGGVIRHTAIALMAPHSSTSSVSMSPYKGVPGDVLYLSFETEIKRMSVFKSYEVGEPTCRLYVKNIAKQVEEKVGAAVYSDQCYFLK